MDESDDQRAVEYGVAVVYGAEQIRQSRPCGSGVNKMHQTIRYITEEAACQCAHYHGRYTRIQNQLAKRKRAALGLYLLHCDDSSQHHHETVADIGHHKSVDDYEKRRHHRVCVNTVVRRQAVHVGYHVHRVCQLIALKLHRHIGVLILDGICDLICAVKLTEKLFKLGFLLCGEPSV